MTKKIIKIEDGFNIHFYRCMKCGKEMNQLKPICVECFLDSINYVPQLAPYYRKVERQYTAFFQKYYYSKLGRKPIEKVGSIKVISYWFTYIAVMETEKGTCFLCDNHKEIPHFKIEWYN